MRYLLPVASLSLLAVTVSAAPPVKLEAAAEPEAKSLMLGEPGFVRFIVSNPGTDNLRATVGGDYRNRLGRPESFTVTVVDGNGVPVPQPDAGPGLGGISYAVDLPAKGRHAFELFLPNWGTFDRPGRYTITIARELTVYADDGTDVFDPNAKSETVAVSAETAIEIEPLDKVRMGHRIDELGRRLVKWKTDDSERAAKLLTAIDDVRVVPYFAELAKAPHQSPRFRACEPLGRYDDTLAVDTLVELAGTRARDVRGGATTLELAESSAASVRHSAALGLANSPHAKARTELWKLAGDDSYAVRMTVLHAAAKDNSPEAAAVIQTMQFDPHDLVRNEARRYAAMR